MGRLIWDEEIECMPLPEVVKLSERRFRESRIMERASRSPLYREKWLAAGVRPEEICTYADLRQVPYLRSGELREAQMQHGPDELVCSDNVRFWIGTSGTTGRPKWIPLSERDTAAFGEATRRLLALILGGTEGWSIFLLSGPAPFISEAAEYNALVTSMLDDRHAEFVFVALPESLDALNFARKAQIQGIFAAPSLAVRIAEGVAKQAGASAREQFRKERSLRNFLGVLATSVMKVKAKHIFKFKWGVFGAEPVDPYRGAITEAYGLQPFSAYNATELYAYPVTDCSAHDGMHFYMDSCIAEMIPGEELEKEEADVSYVPQTTPLWQAPTGSIGELVLTTFADALPLVRYRTSDLIQIVSTGRCACGRTHPRIRVLHRSDDMVNLGLVRFSIYLLKQKLEEVQVHGQIAKWQLRVTREHYKPKALLLVQPRGEVTAEAFVQEIKDKIDGLEGVRQAWENDLIAEPGVCLMEEVVEERGALGKVKLVIYEDAYFKKA